MKRRTAQTKEPKYQMKAYSVRLPGRVPLWIAKKLARSAELMMALMEWDIVSLGSTGVPFKTFLRKTGRGRLVRYADGVLEAIKARMEE